MLWCAVITVRRDLTRAEALPSHKNRLLHKVNECCSHHRWHAAHSLDSFHGFSSPGSKHRDLFPELTMCASEPGMAVHACDPSTWEVEERGSGIQGHPYWLWVHDSQNGNMTIGKKWIQVSSFSFLGSLSCSECTPTLGLPPFLWLFHCLTKLSVDGLYWRLALTLSASSSIGLHLPLYKL